MACSSQPYGGPEIMVFRPTMQEFQDFSAYIKKMEDSGAHRFGIAKVIPPKEWYATKNYDMEKIGKMVIDSPIAQLVTGQQGLYQQYNIQQKPLTVKELKDLAESDKYCPPDGDFEKLERAYWKNITFNPPIYGADVAGSIYDKDVKCWNINHLNTILDLIENERKVKILGVNTAYLYFGMWKTAFAWHTEDMDLYSINYLHFGAPKSWYAIPPEHGKRLETLAAGFFPGSAQTCSQFLRHKMTVISPLMLKKYSIPFYKITQNAGEFMITFPYGYHAGFNQGFNCAESTNFASLRWIDFGKKAKPCTCRSDNVKIEMGLFVKKYQPKQYKEYLESREKRKASSNEQSEEEKKANSKKQENKIKVKRYPAISAVKSIVKAAKKENSEDTSNYKKQRQRAIEKAKNLIKKAEKARRVSSEKKSLQDELPSQKQGGNEARTLEKALKATNDRQMTKDPDAVTGNTGPAAILTQAHFQSEEERRRQRELKLLEIKAEMEREIEERKNKLKNIKIARARRHELRDMKQKLRTRDRATSRPRKVSENKETVETKTKSTPIIAERKAHPSVIKGKEWTSTLSGLWVDEIPSFQREQAYNRRLCKNGHGCAVCAYFDHGLARTMHENESEAASNHQQTLASPLSTTPLVPVTCFMRPELNSTGIPSSETRPVVLPSMMNKESRLVTCTSCLVTVHEKCYGIDETMSSYENNWYCEPCRTNLDLQSRCGIRCEMCPIRGGALKPTTDGRWAHIVCAIAFFDVTFTDVQKRGLIELGSLNNARTKLKCAYCHRSSSDEMNNGACVQCVAGKCAHSFHVTCSFQNGVPLYSGDWPLPLEVYCHQHVKTRSSRGEKRLLAEIQENDFVFAKHKNGRFYKGRVESIESTLFYYVVFEDGSFCHDLPPEDIVNHQPGMLYSKEEKVDVLWTDGIVYPSIIKSHEVILKYEVVFEDGSVLLLKRNDVYREDEELPRKIRAKLSHATETANLLWKASSIRESPTKRARIENKKFAKLL